MSRQYGSRKFRQHHTDIEALLASMKPPATPDAAVTKLPRLDSRLRNRSFASGAAVLGGLATDRRYHAHQVRLDWSIALSDKQHGGRRQYPFQASEGSGTRHRLHFKLQAIFRDCVSEVLEYGVGYMVLVDDDDVRNRVHGEACEG